jgi:hypothetical protein
VSAAPDVPVPYWPAFYPLVRAEAAAAVQFWPTPDAEALLAGPAPEHPGLQAVPDAQPPEPEAGL